MVELNEDEDGGGAGAGGVCRNNSLEPISHNQQQQQQQPRNHHRGNHPLHKSTQMSSSSVSMGRIMNQVVQEQGINGLFKGLSMNWMKGPVSFAISFTTFDLVKEWLEQQ